MAKILNQVLSTLILSTFIFNFPATTWADISTLPGQTLYLSPPPPYECPYPCQPPPTTASNCPPPPSPPLPTPSPPPPSGSAGNPPPSEYYPPPTGDLPYYPPPSYVYPAPPPPNPILPYFPFYYKQPPPPDFSMASCRASVLWISCTILLLLSLFGLD